MPEIRKRVISFQVDGTELELVLEAMKQSSICEMRSTMKEKCYVCQQPAVTVAGTKYLCRSCKLAADSRLENEKIDAIERDMEVKDSTIELYKEIFEV